MDEQSRVSKFAEVTRPIVTIIFTLVVCVGFLQAKLSSDAFLGIATSAITFWFISKSSKDETPKSLPTTTTPTTGDQKGT